MLWEDRVPLPAPPSPRLILLREDVQRRGPEALSAFWTEVAERGTPIVEAGPDRDHALVTFLWRGNDETRHVLVHGDFWFDYWWNNFSAVAMSSIPGTNVWYRTYVMSREARVQYRLAENEPLLHPADDPDPEGGYYDRFVPDPFNPNRVVLEPNDRDPTGRALVTSEVRLSRAPLCREGAREPGVPAGVVETFERESRVLGGRRRVWVYRPATAPEYASLNLLVLFDGWYYTQYIPGPTILDNLIAAGRIPPTVAVMMDNPTDRMGELNGNPATNRFLVEELLPWVRSRWPVTNDPGRTIVGGLSLGGVAAVFAALWHPDVFGNVLSQSGSFWTGRNDAAGEQWVLEDVARRDRVPGRWYLEAGRFEEARDWFATSLLQSNRNLTHVLRAKGYDFRYSEFMGGHAFACWAATLPDALVWLCSDPGSAPQNETPLT